MSEQKELVVIEQANVLTVFTKQDQMEPILERIFSEARSMVPDTSTAKGRAAIASLAYKVAQTKTYLDGLGKDLVSEMKKLPAVVDESRRNMRDKLDALKDEVRQPLTDWEAEQAKIEAEKKAAAEALALAAEVEHCHELALLMNAEHDRAKEQARIEAERKRVADEEKRVADEAARREADTKHKAKMNNEILADLVSNCLLLSDEQAKSIIKAIVSRKIRHTNIVY